MLLSRDAIAAAVEACKPEDFYRPAHGYIFNAVGSPWPSRPYGGATKGKQRSFLVLPCPLGVNWGAGACATPMATTTARSQSDTTLA